MEEGSDEIDTVEDVATHRGLELEDVAMLAGVSADLLRDISDGKVLPDVGHEVAITRVLSDVTTETLRRHSRPDPYSMRSRRGSVPDGYELLLIPVPELRVEDLIAYSPAVRQNGSHWVRVIEDTGDRGAMVTVVLEGGVDIVLSANSMVKIARQKAIR